MGKLDGRVTVIAGAARGQGHSYPVNLTAAGPNIIAPDVCADLEQYVSARAAGDLEETVRLCVAGGYVNTKP
ncbi:hypothetical protein [Nocardia sp. NPDC051750]|uniref:hypothetical protein n=1 Tax=Nocardia sp. NPDC051750 TaxID=3364325 RepID=UPI0037BE05D9